LWRPSRAGEAEPELIGGGVAGDRDGSEAEAAGEARVVGREDTWETRHGMRTRALPWRNRSPRLSGEERQTWRHRGERTWTRAPSRVGRRVTISPSTQSGRRLMSFS
jgi:hypothetical protein